jgi:hypothetical protein
MDIQLGQQRMKNNTRKGFFQDVSYLVLRLNMQGLDHSFCNFIMNNVTIDFNVFRPLMKHRIWLQCVWQIGYQKKIKAG